MKHKSFHNTQCSIARSLELIGEWWSIMIMRDALHGLTRFEHFQKSLDIAPNMLTRRLNSLVKEGLLEKRRYCAHPPRYEYVPTEAGYDLFPVLAAIGSWGNKYLAPEGPSVVLEDRESGRIADAILVDRITGQPINRANFKHAPGRAATERTKLRMRMAAGEISADDYIEKLEVLKAKRRSSKGLPT